MAYETPPLQVIARSLEQEDYVSQFLPADGKRPIDILLVSIGENADAALLLEMTFPNDLLLVSGDLETYDEVMVLQFLIRFRFSFAPEALTELSRFLLAVNPILPVGSFGLSAETGVIFMNHLLHLPTREVDEDVLIAIVDGMDVYATMLHEMIQHVGGQQLTCEEALHQLELQGVTIPSMFPGPASLLTPVPEE